MKPHNVETITFRELVSRLICSILEFFIESSITLGHGCRDIYKGIILKDPCKKCIAQACCSELCKEKKELNRFIFPHENLKSLKVYAWILTISVFISFLSLGSMIIKDFIL